MEKIRAAKAALEAEAQAHALGKTRTVDPPSDRPRRGRPAKTPPGTPHARAQRKFTDPDSRMMKAQDGFIQGYNAQAAVDAAHQVIVAHGLTNQASDTHQLEPMLVAIKANMGRQARELSADAGDCPSTISRHWRAATFAAMSQPVGNSMARPQPPADGRPSRGRESTRWRFA